MPGARVMCDFHVALFFKMVKTGFTGVFRVQGMLTPDSQGIGACRGFYTVSATFSSANMIPSM
jgi:hypothetical protein